MHSNTCNHLILLTKLNSLKWKCFRHLNCVLMLNWIVWNWTVCMYKNVLNKLQWLIFHQAKPIRTLFRLSNAVRFLKRADQWTFLHDFVACARIIVVITVQIVCLLFIGVLAYQLLSLYELVWDVLFCFFLVTEFIYYK